MQQSIEAQRIHPASGPNFELIRIAGQGTDGIMKDVVMLHVDFGFMALSDYG